jgi:predicted transcriptional regulator
MTRKLGRIMGLKFDEDIYSKLTEDFGGHPFLIRHVCSIIHKSSPDERPVRVDKLIYEKAKKKFKSEYSSYIEMILNVLSQFYPEEFDMLKYLALDDKKTFEEFAELSNEFTNHLLGYKIIDHNNGSYFFKIEAVKDYLKSKHKYEKTLNNTEDRWKEISERRNQLEPKLRKIVKNQLQAHLGKSEAFETFLNILGKGRKNQYVSFSYQDLFDPNKSKIYLEDLRKAIIKKYEYFENIFGKNKRQFDAKMESINQYRYDAHAKSITKEEMVDFRTNIKYVEKKVEDFI